MLPYLEQIWNRLLREPRLALPAHIYCSLVEASLATNKLLGASSSLANIEITSFLRDGLPDYLRMAIVNRKSVSLRFKGDHNQSDVLIDDILKSITINSKDIRSYCAYGRLLLSRVENAILRKDFHKATLYLGSWEAKSSKPSGLELQVIRLKNTVLGRLFRYQGDFLHSCHCLEKCLITVPGDASRYHIMHHLGDVFCELGMPEKAEELVRNEIEQLRARGKQQSKSFRRLALPLAEAYIQQRKFDAALAELRELRCIFESIVSHDVSDQLNHVRLLIALARVNWHLARTSETCQLLELALDLTDRYMTFSKGNYYIGVINLFLSVVYFNLHKHAESKLASASATDIFCKEIPRHFIPGMGSYFIIYLHRMKALQLPKPSIAIRNGRAEGV